MQKGLNSDIDVKGRTYHVQTEDWGSANPYLVSRVFAGGAVLKTVKTPYEEALKYESNRNIEALKMALRKQHNRVVDQLMTGNL